MPPTKPRRFWLTVCSDGVFELGFPGNATPDLINEAVEHFTDVFGVNADHPVIYYGARQCWRELVFLDGKVVDELLLKNEDWTRCQSHQDAHRAVIINWKTRR